MFSTAEVELEAFGSFNQPDLFYEFYPDTYPGRKGRPILFYWTSNIGEQGWNSPERAYLSPVWPGLSLLLALCLAPKVFSETNYNTPNSNLI